jgi:hypothetical protein
MSIFALLFFGCSHQLAPFGHFQETSVVADGNADEWSLPLRFSNAEHTFQYSITNDQKNIYICIISTDENTQTKMLKYGMNIYFDPKGEKNKNISLEFPVRKPEQNSYNNGEPIKASSPKIAKDQLLLQSDFYNTSGFANIENGQFSVSDRKNKIQVAIKLHDDSTFVYEAVIPVNNIPGVDPYARKTSKNFSVGISVNSQRNVRNNYNSSPRPSYGMRGMRMGGYRNNPYQNQQPPKEQVDWYQFRLAYNNNEK